MTRLAPAVALALLTACQPQGAPVADNGGRETPAESTNAEPESAASESAAPEPAASAESRDSASPAPQAGACRIQDGEQIAANRIRAIGTEPFWGARVEGRCVTYSTPEDIDGTRVWTRFTGTAENGTWSGHLDNQPFVMRTRPQPGCSDGMSDNRYPIAVSLTVRGEERSGCAEPL